MSSRLNEKNLLLTSLYLQASLFLNTPINCYSAYICFGVTIPAFVIC